MLLWNLAHYHAHHWQKNPLCLLNCTESLAESERDRD